MNRSVTPRGFAHYTFTDRYNQACSLQESSLASEPAIWLGLDNAEPRIMARDAEMMGLEELLTPEGTPERLNGWVDYPIPEEVSLSTRMHLTQSQAKDLIKLLKAFVKTGELPD